jgi:hypothetical protein
MVLLTLSNAWMPPSSRRLTLNMQDINKIFESGIIFNMAGAFL